MKVVTKTVVSAVSIELSAEEAERLRSALVRYHYEATPGKGFGPLTERLCALVGEAQLHRDEDFNELV